MEKELFCYLVDFGSVSAADNLNRELVFASDSDFTIKHIRTNLSDTTEAKITISKETGRQMSNAAFELRAIANVHNALNIFEDTTVPKSSKWNINAVVSAGTSQPLQLQFWGFKN